jgi:hexosaminidase
MTQHHISTYEALFNYFIQQLQSIISNISINTSTTSTTTSATTTIFWAEVFTSNCQINDKLNTIFQVWTDSSIVSEITTAGYQIIASPSNYWYLNTGSNTWTHIYSYNPTMNLNNLKQRNLVIGGELALWGEYVDDNNIIASIYPRASAGAERLWSNENVTNTNDAVDRLFIQRCRMINRGFNIGPVQPGGYCSDVYV